MEGRTKGRIDGWKERRKKGRKEGLYEMKHGRTSNMKGSKKGRTA